MAYTFDATGDAITFGTAAVPLTGSMALWFRPHWAQTDNASHFLFDNNAGVNTKAFSILKFSDNKIYAGYINTTDYRVIVASANYTMNQNAWNHICVTFDDTNNVSKCYLNGTQIGSSTSTLVSVTTTNDNMIGNNTTGQSPHINADAEIAEFAIWNAILDASEVAALAKGYAPSLIRPQSLVNYLPLIREAVPQWGPAPTFTNVTVAAHPPMIYRKATQFLPSVMVLTTAPTGTSSSSGALTKQVNKAPTGTSSSSGALTKRVNKALSGVSSNSGALTKRVNKALSGVSTNAGALVRQVSKVLAGTSTNTGSLTKQVSKILSGTSTNAGALTKVASRVLSGVSTSSGTLSTRISTIMSGVSASAGALTKVFLPGSSYGGASTSSGSLGLVQVVSFSSGPWGLRYTGDAYVTRWVGPSGEVVRYTGSEYTTRWARSETRVRYSGGGWRVR